MRSFFLSVLFFVFLLEESKSAYSSSLCDGEDWIPFKDEKCVKIIKKYANRDEAEEICSNERSINDSFYPRLISIKSAAEQEFLTKFVFDISEVKVKVWIGLERIENSSQYEWNDGSSIRFSNWALGSPSEGIGRDCVEMQSKFTKINSYNTETEGKWNDVTCEAGNWIVCQKLQTWSFPQMQKTLLDTRKELKDSLVDVTEQLENEKIELRNTKIQLNNANTNIENLQRNPVPIGFIYVQLPSQPEPTSLWSTVTWTDVSSEYAGLFFRVLGQGSADFGASFEQSENAPKLTHVEFQAEVGGSAGTINLPVGGWSDFIRAGNFGQRPDAIRFFVSGGEVRPRNKAVRIWKRT